MGGMGSGSWYRWQGKKQVVEDALGLNINRLVQWGALRFYGPGRFWQGSIQWRYGEREPFASAGYTVTYDGDSGPLLTMHYRIDGRENIDQPIALQSTRPNYGGARWWFTCPGCHRRAGRLYLPSGVRFFACRRCYDLTYRSAQEHDKRLSFLLNHPDDADMLLDAVMNNPAAPAASSLLAIKAYYLQEERFLKRLHKQKERSARKRRATRRAAPDAPMRP
jgi:hypothetical protein